MPIFTVRVDADALRPPTPDPLDALRATLADFHPGIAVGEPDTRWTVTITVRARTIEEAAGYGVALVIDAANLVDMPPSDIAAREIVTDQERARRGHLEPAPASQPARPEPEMDPSWAP